MNIILFDSLPEGSLIPAADERACHIMTVLKLKAGDSFKMGIVNESEGLATIEEINNDGVKIQYTPSLKPSLYPVTLVIAQVRPICMKRILREAVSLGVERIILTGSDTGEKSYRESSFYRDGEYRNCMLDGAMQSAHAGLPEVVFTDYVGQAVETVQSIYRGKEVSLIMLDNVTGAIPLSKTEISSNAVLAIGPERGWSERERKRFTDSGFESKLLGSRVLRTETACSTGTAVLLSRMNLL